MLKPKKKITKQEIERDPVLEKTIEMEKFIRRHAQTMLIAIGVIALIVVVGIFTVKSGKAKKLDASGKLGLAQMSYQRGDIDDAVLRLEEVIEDFGGSNPAGAAHIQLGQIYMDKGDYETAETYYEDYVDKYKDSLGKTAAYKALGVCAENSGNLDEAVGYYEQAIKAADHKFQKQIAQISLANVSIQLKDFATAKELLDEVKDNEPEYSLNMQVELLSGKLAALDK